MIRISQALILLATFGLFHTQGLAQTPESKPQDVIANPKAKESLPDVKGAIVVEDSAALPPEAFNGAKESEALKDGNLPKELQENPTTADINKSNSSESSSSKHYFGFHAAAGLPHPVSFGLNYLHSSELFSVELNTGSFNLNSGNVGVGMSHTQLGLRWHPFQGAFFLGANYGQRKILGKTSDTISSIQTDVEITVSSNYIQPQLGWMWGVKSGGFFAALEFGYLSPSGVTSTLTTNADNLIKATDEYKKLEKDAQDAGKNLGSIGLPSLTLLKLGFLF